MVKAYRNQVRRNIDYLEFSEDYASCIQQLDEIVDLMVETLCSTRPTISVAGDNLPASLVKEQLLKINCLHIQYVMDSLKANTTPVRNIKRYLLTVCLTPLRPSTITIRRSFSMITMAAAREGAACKRCGICMRHPRTWRWKAR